MDKDKRNKNKEGDNYMDKTIIIIGFQFIYMFLEKWNYHYLKKKLYL